MKLGLRHVQAAMVSLLSLVSSSHAQTYDAQHDWPYLSAYRHKNDILKKHTQAAGRVVFMGDSITEFWEDLEKSAPPNLQFVNRGISGQTTPQMLLRFRADVIDLHPTAVVILAGTNDVAGNTGPATNEMIEDNIASMCDLAAQHHIRVILSSILPAASYPWAPELHPIAPITAINAWLKHYATQHQLTYLDYYGVMNDGAGGLPKVYSEDGVHPNAAGYQVMLTQMKSSLQHTLTSN